MIWSPSGKSVDETWSNQATLTATGAMELESSIRLARTAQELAEENDVLIFALPANGHKQVFEAIAGFVREDQQLIISSHSSLGALYMSQLLQSSRKDASFCITAWGTTVCTARSAPADDEGPMVRINTIRQNVDTCTVPSSLQDSATQLCKHLFKSGGDGEQKIGFRPREGLLAISLSNLNPQNHLGIALGNISRMEKGETWYQVRFV